MSRGKVDPVKARADHEAGKHRKLPRQSCPECQRRQFSDSAARAGRWVMGLPQQTPAEETAQRITDDASEMANHSAGKFGTDQKYIAKRYLDAAALWRKAGNVKAAEMCEKRAGFHSAQKVG